MSGEGCWHRSRNSCREELGLGRSRGGRGRGQLGEQPPVIEQAIDGLALGEPRPHRAVASTMRARLDIGLKDAGQELGPRHPVELGGHSPLFGALRLGAVVRLKLLVLFRTASRGW